MGGRLKLFHLKWANITSSPWVRNTISTGLKINFLSLPPNRYMISKHSDTENTAIIKELQLLQQKSVLIPVPEEEKETGFYSPLFLVQKPNGSYRTIFNLKSLNKFVVYEKFKMESIRSTIPLLTKNCVMASIDLEDAYYHVPIHPDYQRYLRLAVQRRGKIIHLQFQAMPFGISSAPRVFTKLIREVMAYAHCFDITCVPYLDDFLLIANSPSKLRGYFYHAEHTW